MRKVLAFVLLFSYWVAFPALSNGSSHSLKPQPHLEVNQV